ncbi:hypothetical protein V5O48_008689 [Marasmius crinis-equi]|uniref:F-box domain-containing protein n=1 Tax=Marasmius crinis-equi TaxID=585013 RepID=A0ABR3FD66_9AGAR
MGPSDLSQNFKLPYDILLYTFTFYVKNLLASSSKKIKSSDWLSFTHVCRCWRTAALESPTLWTEPDFRFPSIARETLKRSQSLSISLSIRASKDAKRQELAIDVLKEHFSRIADLNLSFSSPSALEAVLRVAVRPALSLHTLSLKAVCDEDMARVVLPDNFLGSVSAGLRRLAINGFSIPWNSKFLKDLTHFEVGLSSPDLSVSQLLQVLRRCPALESLKVWDCLFTTGDDAAPVELPRLSRLDLNAQMPVLVELVSVLKLPPSTRTQLGCSAGESEASPADMVHLLRPLLVSPETGKPTRDITALSFEWTAKHRILSCIAHNEIPSHVSSKEFFSLYFVFPTTTPPNLGEYVHNFLEATPISNLRLLRFGNVSISPPTIRLVSTLPKLQALDLESTAQTCAFFIQALGIQEDADQQKCPFPSLTVLRFSSVVFGSSQLELRSLLIKNVLSRRARGVGINALILVSCTGLLEEDLHELKVHVRAVLEEA